MSFGDSHEMVQTHYHYFFLAILVTAGVKLALAEDALQAISSTADSSDSSANGPVTAAIENLAFNVASIADEIALQVNRKLERTADILHGSIETLITNALEELALPIFQASRKLSHESCNTTLSVADLRANIDLHLSNCTGDLNSVLQSYKFDAEQSISKIENLIDEVVNLPKACQVLLPRSAVIEGTPQNFATGTNCFVERMAVWNEQVSKELDAVGQLLSRTRQLSQESEAQALSCIGVLVNAVGKLIDEELSDC
uniref:Dynein heavy chain, cytoplasmic n=1 Tax=Zeugodacus cucurbitae TaxID=28588 RepID=A0A0A1WZI1_ZEUCU